MAGLMDIFADPEKSQMLGLLAQGLAQRDGLGGILAANQFAAGAPDRALARELKTMQLEEARSQIAQRQAAIDKQKALQEMTARIFPGGIEGSAPSAQPAQPGQLGSGSFGVVQPQAGQSSMPAPIAANRLASVPYDSIVALKAAGGPDLTQEWKIAREGFERKAGTYYEGVNGGTKYMPDPTKGMDYQNGRISAIPGFSDFVTQQTLATEAPKALLNAAGTLNLRDNPDGSKSPVSALSENPTLQSILGTLFQGGGRAPQQGQPAPMRAPTVGAPNASEAGMRDQIAGPMGADPATLDREIAATTADLKKPLDQASRDSLTAHLADLQRIKQKIATEPQRQGPYGTTTEQDIANAAAKEKAMKTAAADVMRATGLKDDAKRYGQMKSGVDRAIELLQAGPTESGFGSMMDSAANFVGQTTTSANLASQLDTLSGWLTANTPRMEGPQSDKDVQQYRIMAGMVGDRTKPAAQRLAAAQELKGLQDKYASLNGYGGASPTPQQPAQKQMIDALPATAPKGQRVRDTQTGKVLEFNGQSWVEAK